MRRQTSAAAVFFAKSFTFRARADVSRMESDFHSERREKKFRGTLQCCCLLRKLIMYICTRDRCIYGFQAFLGHFDQNSDKTQLLGETQVFLLKT